MSRVLPSVKIAYSETSVFAKLVSVSVIGVVCADITLLPPVTSVKGLLVISSEPPETSIMFSVRVDVGNDPSVISISVPVAIMTPLAVVVAMSQLSTVRVPSTISIKFSETVDVAVFVSVKETVVAEVVLTSSSHVVPVKVTPVVVTVPPSASIRGPSVLVVVNVVVPVRVVAVETPETMLPALLVVNVQSCTVSLLLSIWKNEPKSS